MQLEIEQKYRVTDPAALRERLVRFGVEFGEPVEQADAYFNHPSRDFAETDEALRIRNVGARNFVTYKGPKLDREVKTRHEVELPLAAGADVAGQYGELLKLLGFRASAVVRKRRASATLERDNARFEICWDEVAGLGTFVEIELVVDAAGADDARRRILDLANELNLTTVERRSYLAMVLGRDEAR